MFLRLGNAPFGSDSKVLRPISMVFPVVNALKRFKSFGNQKRSLFSKPIAMRRSTAAMMDTLLIFFTRLLLLQYADADHSLLTRSPQI